MVRLVAVALILCVRYAQRAKHGMEAYAHEDELAGYAIADDEFMQRKVANSSQES